VPIIGDCAHVLEDMVWLWRSSLAQPDKKALDGWWKQIEKWRAQFARLQELEPDQCRNTPSSGSRELTKNRDTYITTEVASTRCGGAVLPLRGAEPLMTSGGLGTMGYTAGRGGRAARASEVAGHRHRR
jgi:acetolactate synthase-1/2/3 large subunit